jgi:hypothetical protein
MPDLSFETHHACSDVDYFQVNVGDYTVACDRGRWSCGCKGFQFRNMCKHVKEAQTIRCSWSSEWSDEEAKDDGKCPVCGNDTIVYRSAV